MQAVRSIGLLMPDEGAELGHVAAVFRRVVEERCPAKVACEGPADLAVELAVTPGIGAEGYTLADGDGGGVRIIGNDRLGLLYGVGKFLRTSRYERDGLVPGTWRGTSVPQCPVRGIYMAVHFGNYYEAAPAEEVQRYLEELALWGLNAVAMSFPAWQFSSFDDPRAVANIRQIRQLAATAKRVGIRVGLFECNQGFATAPPDILATLYPDDWHRRGSLGVNVCPSNPSGRAYLLDLYGRLFDEFDGIELDYLISWPYDEGGCGCPQCWPWGAAGYPHLVREVAELARRKHPGIRTVLSTWMYDTPPAGEWDGLAALLAADGDWLDYVMADAHEDFPQYPLTEGVPGGLPLLNFPEISMWHMAPWGGFGANPLPARQHALWSRIRGALAGGFPYSEGIYEDLNKVIWQQFYWQKDRDARDAVREYASFEFSPGVAEDVVAAVDILESNHERPRRVPLRLDGADEAFGLIRKADKELLPWARGSWRWRLLYLRAMIDSELRRNGGRFEGEALRDAFDELRRIYHVTDHTRDCVRPPVVED